MRLFRNTKPSLSQAVPKGLALFTVLLFGWVATLAAQPLGSAFTYQGRLEHNGQAATGLFDLDFELYSHSSGGALIGTATKFGVPVSEGLFTVELDFGGAAFDGDERWLEIGVRPAGSGGFTVLSPRHRIAPAPYALHALSSADGTPWSGVGSTIFYNSGNVGIGTSAAGQRLTVAGTIESTSGGFKFPDGTRQTTAATSVGGDNLGNHIATQDVTFDNLEGIKAVGGAYLHTGVNGGTWFAKPGNSSGHRFGVEPDNAVPGNGQAEFVIDNQGRVGIGKDRFFPTQTLDVNGSGQFSRPGTDDVVLLGSDGNAFIELRGTGTPYIDFANDGTTDFDMRIRLTGDDAMVIEGGRLGIGGSMTNPAYAIDLPNLANASGRGRANQWLTYSSIRWKENVRDLDSSSEKLRRLRGVEFDWKEAQGGTHGIGFIAEEVGAVLPELVEWEADGRYALGLNYSGVTPLLVEAMKEQMGIIDGQKSEIEQLKEIVCLDHPQAELCR